MNHKEYLLGLLDGSHTLSHEGVGLVLERLAALERVADAVGSTMPYGTLSDEVCDALAALEKP